MIAATCKLINKRGMSSSGSDSDNETKIREAVDQEFINNIIKAEGTTENATRTLRPQTPKPCVNDLKVTPEFQKHVAKHLDIIIQKQIKEVIGVNKIITKKMHKGESGIRMFSNSKRISKSDLESEIARQNSLQFRKRKLPKSFSTKESDSDESAEEFERLRSAAVSPEWILHKKGVYGKCCEKGKVLNLIDRGNGHLVECGKSTAT